MNDDDESTATAEVAALPQDLASGSTDMARIMVLTGADSGRRHTFRPPLVIGRSPRLGLSLRDRSASREHARIIQTRSGTWLVEDMRSMNGTRLNGVTIKRSAEIRFGDRLAVGESVLLFTHADPLEDRLAQREKLEIIGRLAAGMTHDLNNLLAVISAGAEHSALLVRDGDVAGPGCTELLECLDDITSATRCSGELTRHLLEFARRDGIDVGPLDFSELAVKALALAQRTMRAGIKVVDNLEPGLFVSGNRGQLHQMLMNLLLNARDAMVDGGTLSLTVTPGPAPEQLTLRVADTGRGMDAATRAALFTPFFTTKAEGHGIGLATTHAVIAAHGGTIACESSPGHGATFVVHLPRIDPPVQRRKSTDVLSRQPAAWRQATVLVVDDDASVQRSVARLLAQAGHMVLQSWTGRDALDTLASTKSAIDVVVLDFDLPDIDAHSLLLSLAAEGIGVPTLIISGRVDAELAKNLTDAGARSVLLKPFSGTDLLGAIADCAAAPTATVT